MNNFSARDDMCIAKSVSALLTKSIKLPPLPSCRVCLGCLPTHFLPSGCSMSLSLCRHCLENLSHFAPILRRHLSHLPSRWATQTFGNFASAHLTYIHNPLAASASRCIHRPFSNSRSFALFNSQPSLLLLLNSDSTRHACVDRC